MLFSAAGETIERARVLITLGGMYFLQGELIRAIETTKAGLLDLPGEERYLHLCGRYNLERFLAMVAGQSEEIEVSHPRWREKRGLHQMGRVEKRDVVRAKLVARVVTERSYDGMNLGGRSECIG